MSKRIPKVNSLIQRTFGEILQREADVPADVLVTVSSVECAPNLQSATIWLYISSFPSTSSGQATAPGKREEEALEALKGQLYYLQGILNKKLKMRPLPRISLKLDYGAVHAQRIDPHLADLAQGRP
ncbi:MAG: ribosome-binding factor A, partial [Patescibacteria group bacterium]